MNQTIRLWKDPAINSTLTYIPREDGVLRPAMLVIPGGGYGCVCKDTEGFNIAARFEKLGFQTFVLEYRVWPFQYPDPQMDAFRAIKLIRANAAKWGVIKNQLAVCGFSAGAHLSCCCGTLFRDFEVFDGDAADHENQRPDAMVLSYPVITSGPKAHSGSFHNLLRDRYDELKETFSLEKRVTAETTPAFVWATHQDEMVPYENSLMFAQAMWDAGRPCELHMYPNGPHGLELGIGRSDIASWPDQAKEFIRLNAHFDFPDDPKKPQRTVILTFDDAVKNHLTFVAPLLKKYGFGATFFPCRWSEEWCKSHGDTILSASELKRLHDMGFEIGNHTWSHPDMSALSDVDAAKEIDSMTDFLTKAGIPKPTSFAYPGGPFAPNITSLLKDRGYTVARTVEGGVWTPGKTEPLRVPATAISHDDWRTFYYALRNAGPDHAVVYCLHGVPEIVHEAVTNTPEFLQEMVDYLRDNGYRVISLAQYAQENA